jgi:hypothetical protein
MDEHLDKILPLHVKELGDGEGPVESQGEHVVPPHILIQLVVWVVIPVKISTFFKKKDFKRRKAIFKVPGLWIRIRIGNPDPGSGTRGKKMKKNNYFFS